MFIDVVMFNVIVIFAIWCWCFHYLCYFVCFYWAIINSTYLSVTRCLHDRRQLWALTTITLAADQSDRPSPSSGSIVISVQNNYCRREGRIFLSLKFRSFVSRYAHSPQCFVAQTARHVLLWSDTTADIVDPDSMSVVFTAIPLHTSCTKRISMTAGLSERDSSR